MVLRHSQFLSLVLVLSLAGLTACGKKEPAKPKVDPKPKVVVKPKVDPKPKEDPLAKAKAKADEDGVNSAVALRDVAVAVAGAVEAAKKPDAGTVKIKRVGRLSKPPSGKIDPKSASKVFRKYNGGMQKCYERALKRSQGLEGKVQLTLRIRSNGTVRSARVRGLSMNSSTVNKCMGILAKKMKFPPPKGGEAQVRKTYKFTPQL